MEESWVISSNILDLLYLMSVTISGIYVDTHYFIISGLIALSVISRTIAIKKALLSIIKLEGLLYTIIFVVSMVLPVKHTTYNTVMLILLCSKIVIQYLIAFIIYVCCMYNEHDFIDE